MVARHRRGWSIDDALEECEMHLNHMRLIIKGVEGTKKVDDDLRRTLNYSLHVLRDRRKNLLHVRAALDRVFGGT